MIFTWQQAFMSQTETLSVNGEKIGQVECYGASWMAVYKGNAVAVRPDKEAAKTCLIRLHTEMEKGAPA